MKLKTKLIPFVSIASLSAIVSPIALTSCSNNSWVDMTKIYQSKIERAENIVTGEYDPERRYDDGAFCKNYYFEQIKQNTNIYKDDFYYGHSVYLQAIQMFYGVIIDYAQAKIYDISCQDSGKAFPWQANPDQPQQTWDVEIWTMSFTAEFSISMHNPQKYLGMDNVSYVKNVGKFTVKDVPMWLEYADGTDYTFTLGFTPRFFPIHFYQATESFDWLMDNFEWSITQDTVTTVTRDVPGTSISYTMKIPANYIAYDNTTLGVMMDSGELVAGVDDFANSWYMSKVDQTGRS